jgi:beta-1,3-galactosyltransferase 1/2/3/4/5/7/8
MDVHYLTLTIFSRMWTLPEANELPIPNARRQKEAELAAGDCNLVKVILSLA